MKVKTKMAGKATNGGLGDEAAYELGVDKWVLFG